MSEYSYRHFDRDSEQLYRHLLDLRKSATPATVIERFRCLFIDGIGYPDDEIRATLNRLVLSKWADQGFSHLLNRCCYILLNHWWLQAESKLEFRQATIDLVNLFDTPPNEPADFLVVQRLQEFVRQFAKTEQRAALKQRAQIAEDIIANKKSTASSISATSFKNDTKAEPVGNLIHRYPCLYPHYLLSWDSSEMGQQAVKQLQVDREKQFEENLKQYTTQLLKQASNPDKIPPQVVENPTLLSADNLKEAIRRFAGKAEGSQTCWDSAQQFLRDIQCAATYQEVKRKLHNYLTSSIRHSCNPEYGKQYFNDWLNEQLKSIFPQSDMLKPNRLLLVQTCGQLLERLVAHPTRLNDHMVFADMTTNLGATFTVSLLLKIVLLFRGSKANLEVMKSYLARRFAIVLKHYETKIRGEIEWLVESLENWTIALSIHFGRTQFGSYISSSANLLG